MDNSNGSPRHGHSESYDVITTVVITEKEVAQLPPGSIVIRSFDDWEMVKPPGGVVYVVSEADHTIRPMTDEDKAAYRRFWERQGRTPPEDFAKPEVSPSE